jgi:catechol 1,2-dioxygenase
MQRRNFLKNTGMVAVGVGVWGNLAWSKDRFIGDTPTTTDMLGPFYRPGAPFRADINPQGYTGKKFHISGTIFKEDGKTPFKNCLVEVWQCDEKRLYDNISDEFKYRGAQKTGADGKYHFIGMHPIPYLGIENTDIWRPAHIHMLISGEGQQDLITQVYLEGDPHLEKDMLSASPEAVKRILKIGKNSNDEEAIRFDLVMKKEFKPENSVFHKITGIYKMNDKSFMEFYKHEDLLFLKWNGHIREGLSYRGKNTFVGGVADSANVQFALRTNNEVKVTVHLKTIISGNVDLEGMKTLKYNS